MAVYTSEPTLGSKAIDAHILARGFSRMRWCWMTMD